MQPDMHVPGVLSILAFSCQSLSKWQCCRSLLQSISSEWFLPSPVRRYLLVL